MARNGHKIFDADTHVRPDAELLEPYMTNGARAKLSQYESYRAKNKDGAVTYLMGERSYKRRLGSSGEAAPQKNEYMSGYKRHQHGKPDPLCERDPAVRVKDMDTEVLTVKPVYSSTHLPESRLMKEFMKRHYPDAKYTVMKGWAEDEIVKHLKKQKENTLVVLGAYRRGAVSRLFRESMADVLMKKVKLPLFIAHNK